MKWKRCPRPGAFIADVLSGFNCAFHWMSEPQTRSHRNLRGDVPTGNWYLNAAFFPALRPTPVPITKPWHTVLGLQCLVAAGNDTQRYLAADRCPMVHIALPVEHSPSEGNAQPARWGNIGRIVQQQPSSFSCPWRVRSAVR